MPSLRSAFLLSAILTAALCGGGCSTPGPLHVYSVAPTEPATIHDRGDTAALDVPSFVTPEETVTGFAYDPFTDHFFLRLAPGNILRVVDRPARAIKREFTAKSLPTTGGGDLAVSPRDGHVFAILPDETALAEITRFAWPVRKISLAGLTTPPSAVAYDSIRDQLILFTAPSKITTHTLDGRLLSTLTLDREIAVPSLAFDAERSELYLPLADGASVGIFGLDGKLLRTLPLAARFVDLGPRSFLRLF